jgi:hypothetical protein
VAHPPSDRSFKELGQVTISSGVALVIDTGLLKFWCHDRPPLMPEGAAPDDVVASANAATDFRLEGSDAERAGRVFDRQWHPLFLYDIPSHGVEKVRASFAACVREHGLDARLVPLDQRVSHRRRVDEALAYGGAAGEVMFQGITAVAVTGVQADRPLAILGERMPSDGPDAGRWRSVWLECLPGGEVVRSELAGTVAVDEARLMFTDVDALGQWQHEQPLDGQADFVFWGRDAERVARATGAADLGNGQWGWVDLPVRETVQRGIAVEEMRDQNSYKLATDFRPHSHHFLVMRQVRATPTESGTVEVGGVRVCTFMTSWGDGFFPVFRDVDAGGRLVRVRIDLGNDQIVERQRQFEQRYPSR